MPDSRRGGIEVKAFDAAVAVGHTLRYKAARVARRRAERLSYDSSLANARRSGKEKMFFHIRHSKVDLTEIILSRALFVNTPALFIIRLTLDVWSVLVYSIERANYMNGRFFYD